MKQQERRRKKKKKKKKKAEASAFPEMIVGMGSHVEIVSSHELLI